MGFLDWLRGKTPRDEDIVDLSLKVIPEGSATFVVETDLVNEGVELAPDATGQDTGQDEEAAVRFDLEPIFLVIDHRRVAGSLIRRRITTHRTQRQGRNFYLVAICHERRAHRTFRLDRIEGIIDDDGVVEETEPFLLACVEGDPGYAVQAGRKRRSASRANPNQTASVDTWLRHELSPAAATLPAAARVDQRRHPEQVDCIMWYTETDANALWKESILAGFSGREGFERPGRRIKRTRPTQTDLDEALETIQDWDDARLQRLKQAVVSVIQAEGLIVTEEHALAQEISDWIAEMMVERK